MCYDVDNHVLYVAAFLVRQFFHLFMELLFTMLIFQTIKSQNGGKFKFALTYTGGMKA